MSTNVKLSSTFFHFRLLKSIFKYFITDYYRLFPTTSVNAGHICKNIYNAMAPTFVTLKDIQRLFQCSTSTASDKLGQARAALGKKKLLTGRWQPVTRTEFCDYWGIDITLLVCEKSTSLQAV